MALPPPPSTAACPTCTTTPATAAPPMTDTDWLLASLVVPFFPCGHLPPLPSLLRLREDDGQPALKHGRGLVSTAAGAASGGWFVWVCGWIDGSMDSLRVTVVSIFSKQARAATATAVPVRGGRGAAAGTMLRAGPSTPLASTGRTAPPRFHGSTRMWWRRR